MMKNYTPALINTKKPKLTLKTFFLGSSAAKNYYYYARHKTDDIYILWIETTRFGNSFCFPCVLDEQGDAMVYLTGKGVERRMQNNAMLQRWNLFVKPATFAAEFDGGELAPESFHEEYVRYKNAALGLSDGAEPAEDAEDAEPAEARDDPSEEA